MPKVIALVPSDQSRSDADNGTTAGISGKPGPSGGSYRPCPDGYCYVPAHEDAAPLPISNFVAKISVRTVADEHNR